MPNHQKLFLQGENMSEESSLEKYLDCLSFSPIEFTIITDSEQPHPVLLYHLKKVT